MTEKHYQEAQGLPWLDSKEQQKGAWLKYMRKTCRTRPIEMWRNSATGDNSPYLGGRFPDLDIHVSCIRYSTCCQDQTPSKDNSRKSLFWLTLKWHHPSWQESHGDRSLKQLVMKQRVTMLIILLFPMCSVRSPAHGIIQCRVSPLNQPNKKNPSLLCPED